MKIKIKKANLIVIILLAIITILLASFVINLTTRNDKIVSEKIATTIGKLEEEKVKMSVKIKERLGNGIVYVLVKIESEEEIDNIVFPNEDGTNLIIKPQAERRTIAKDLKVELKKEYQVTINTRDGESVTKTIFLEADGTKEHPFIIRTKEELQAVNDDLSAYYILGANIDLTDFEFIPIGSQAAPFTGNIDGTGYTISKLNIDSEESDNIGLFGYSNGTISNITLENITVKGKSNVGGLSGTNTGTVTNCVVSGNVIGAGDNTGGLIGYNSGIVTNNQTEGSVTGTGSNTGGLIGQTITGISGNTSKAEVHGQANTGGLVGYVYMNTPKSITLSNNVSEGKVIGTNQVGGLIGSLYQRTTGKTTGTYAIYVKRSYATGDVEGTSNVGGLVGYQYGYIHNEIISANRILYNFIEECYATGNVIGAESNVGGLIGYMYSANDNTYYEYRLQDVNLQIKDSFATGNVEGAGNVGGLVGYIYRKDKSVNDGGYTHAYVKLTNTYAIGEVTSEGQAGGLIGTSTGSGYGSTTVTNSYWTPETTKQENSTLGTKNLIPYMMRKLGYDDWDFETIWEIEEGSTIAYLKNVKKPESVNRENIEYEEFDVVGEGTESSPFIITHPVQLQKITDRLDSYYKLGANIDLEGREFIPIGTQAAPFIGNIDGTGYIISNLNIDNEEGENVGLFGYNSGTISNITLENTTVKGKTNVGGLVGYNLGTIDKCTVTANTIGAGDNVGGLIGYNKGTVTNNQTEGTVINTGNNTGGLIGQNYLGTATNNTSKVNVNGKNNTGGLIGYIYSDNVRTITISENVVEGNVVGEAQTGGLIGSVYQRTTGKTTGTYAIYVKRSYATGNVEGTSNVGGLVGYQYGYIHKEIISANRILYNFIEECYATGDVIGTESNVGGLIGYMYSANDNTYYEYRLQDVNLQIKDSFATGNVEGKNQVGGLVGYIYRKDKSVNDGGYTHAYVKLTNTYAIGEVISEGQAGGLVGTSTGSGYGSTTVTDSFWNTETTKQETSVLGTAANTASMIGTELYTNWSADIWTIEEGQYPKLNF